MSLSSPFLTSLHPTTHRSCISHVPKYLGFSLTFLMHSDLLQSTLENTHHVTLQLKIIQCFLQESSNSMSFFKTTMTLAAASLPSLVPSFTPTQVTQLCSLNPQTVLPGIPTLLYSFDFDAPSKSELAKPQVSFAQPKWVHSIQPNVCNPGRRPRDSFCFGQVKILAILTRSLITTRGFRS